MEYVLIEVATVFAPWVSSWWLISLIALSLVIVWTIAYLALKTEGIVAFVGAGIIGSCLAAVLWAIPIFESSDYISDAEAQRVSAEIEEATGQELSVEQVRSMQDKNFVEGVNYDMLRSSDNELVFKVEVEVE